MKKRYLIPIILSGVMLLLNIIARLSRSFSDFYVQKIFPVISQPFSFLSGILPFSLGEFMIIAFILAVAVGIPLTVILLIFRKKSRRKTRMIFAVSALWIFTYILTTETMNCFIMYQCTPLAEQFFPGQGEHSREELLAMYEDFIDEANALSEVVSRDENGHFVLTDELYETAKNAMKGASEEFPQLRGYYPDAKPVLGSFFMSQAWNSGIYFPFSLEANYNADMYDIMFPSTICHEYTHLKGIILEDEAGFLAFVAASQSESADFRYSAYIDAIEYIQNEVYENDIQAGYDLEMKISEKVERDLYCFVPEDYWEENEDKTIISTETFDAVTDVATDTSLKFNGVEDGIDSYGRMVNLLLDYYVSRKN